jgi:single-stranded-DNA-specific exonuclease
VAQIDAWSPEEQARRAYAVHGDWNEGVVGIVASRLVERYNRPVIVLSAKEDEWKGSGRSIPTFDLHASLAASAGTLERWGGHRAAAGLSLAPESYAAFVEQWTAYAERELSEEELSPRLQVDAIVPRGTRLTLDLCGELARLAPFGLGNPEVMLLAPGCELGDVATVGEGKHLRYRVRRDGSDVGSAIHFGAGARLDAYRSAGRRDVAFRLTENRWNGTVSPQLVVRRVFASAPRFDELRDWLVAEWKKPDAARDSEAALVFAELELEEAGLGRRHLLESERFRALLELEPVMARAA